MTVNEQILSRLRDTRYDYKITPQQIAEVGGISVDTINKQLQGVNKLSVATLYAMAILAPDISTNWLLTGTGNKYVRDNNKQTLQELKSTYVKLNMLIDQLSH